MKRTSTGTRLTRNNLAPALEGFYERVAATLDVDVLLVVRVALGQTESSAVEKGLRRELQAIRARIAEDSFQDDAA